MQNEAFRESLNTSQDSLMDHKLINQTTLNAGGNNGNTGTSA